MHIVSRDTEDFLTGDRQIARMSNAISLLKANYCRSIIRTASIGTEDEARRFIEGLLTEPPTPGTSPEVAEAEAAAFAAIANLASHVAGRTPLSGIEWTKASRAVERWIALAS